MHLKNRPFNWTNCHQPKKHPHNKYMEFQNFHSWLYLISTCLGCGFRWKYFELAFHRKNIDWNHCTKSGVLSLEDHYISHTSLLIHFHFQHGHSVKEYFMCRQYVRNMFRTLIFIGQGILIWNWKSNEFLGTCEDKYTETEQNGTQNSRVWSGLCFRTFVKRITWFDFLVSTPASHTFESFMQTTQLWRSSETQKYTAAFINNTPPTLGTSQVNQWRNNQYGEWNRGRMSRICRLATKGNPFIAIRQVRFAA